MAAESNRPFRLSAPSSTSATESLVDPANLELPSSQRDGEIADRPVDPSVTPPLVTPPPPARVTPLKIPVTLSVSNLDGKIGKREWRELLWAMFKQHVDVLDLQLRSSSPSSSTSPSGSIVSSASILVPSDVEARICVSKLHRHKVGCKNIRVEIGGDPVTSSEIVPLMGVVSPMRRRLSLSTSSAKL